MSQINTQITINANIKQVWDVLVNYGQYQDWNTFFKDVQGEAKEGSTLKVTICPPNGKPMAFSPVLIKVTPEQEIRWVGKFLCRHVFQGEHYFQLKKLAEDKTEFVHGEVFSGVLSAVFNKFFASNTQKGFEIFNQQLKQRVENSVVN